MTLAESCHVALGLLHPLQELCIDHALSLDTLLQGYFPRSLWLSRGRSYPILAQGHVASGALLEALCKAAFHALQAAHVHVGLGILVTRLQHDARQHQARAARHNG